jgi:hypothetical protein
MQTLKCPGQKKFEKSRKGRQIQDSVARCAAIRDNPCPRGATMQGNTRTAQ